jgi:hypothetical protein
LVGALANLGHQIGRNTIKRVPSVCNDRARQRIHWSDRSVSVTKEAQRNATQGEAHQTMQRSPS